MNRKDVLYRHPCAPLGFSPTHHVKVFLPGTSQVLREDFVHLEDTGTGPVKYAYTPDQDFPIYGVLSTGLWQCLEVHGQVEHTAIQYIPDYVNPKERQGVVYFLEAGVGGPIKIGWSQDVFRRVAELQTANAHKLILLGTMPGTMEDEARVHTIFSHLRMEAEWFSNNVEIKAFLETYGTLHTNEVSEKDNGTT